ncbi:MAG: family 10 glycosylhydrolase [Chroococcidiopsidaceae cyanobacterium CP_BM_ER_R8_30]|nr:family 10 glycosylhydrolase [Chroococcidiopsidaceae cyanobacterium CP_BM_ER_R8_30]
MLRTMLGGYWGFNLTTPAKLEPLRNSTQDAWLHTPGLAGNVSGGVVIPTSLTSQPAAIWESKSSAPAVVTTEQSALLGWTWGADAASSVQLDSAWLKALLSHYLQLAPGITTNSTCPTPVVQTATASPNPKPATTQPKPTPTAHPILPVSVVQAAPSKPAAKPQPKTPPIHPATPNATAKKPQPKTLPIHAASPPSSSSNISALLYSPPLPSSSTQQSKEATAQLIRQGLEVVPGTREPVDSIQAISLPQELENMIGRFESAELDANAKNSALGTQGFAGGGSGTADEGEGRGDGEPVPFKSRVGATDPNRLNFLEQAQSRSVSEGTEVASTNVSLLGSAMPVTAPATVVSQARDIAKTLPQLIEQKNYTAARQQWLKAQQLLWNNYPTNRNLAQPEIRAIWLDRGTIVGAGSEQRLAHIFDELAAAGINTVFFETINAGYPIYPSRVAPQLNPLVHGWDPLAVAVKLAHERGMELHAWVWTFAVGNQRHNLLVGLPADYPGPVLAAHPDWASYDNHGSLFPPGQGKPFLDPANPAARQYLMQMLEEIVSRYQVDGLQLDYIRYPFQDPSADRSYGYGIAARQMFQQMTGVDPIQISPSDRDLWQKWTDFRTQQIDSFVARVSHQLRQQRPNLILSVAVYPFSEHDRINKLQQHWEVWARRGDVNLVVPMTYAIDTYRFQHLIQPWLTSADLGPTLILPGIRLLDLPLAEVMDQIQLVRDLPASGYSLFATENFSRDLATVFQHTQGNDSSTDQAPIPYRKPFQTAAARFAALEQEWNFLLANQRLWLQEPDLSLWRTQSQELGKTLNHLAAAPSISGSAAALAALTSFTSHFQVWMRPQALEHPYQVTVWSNRLDAIEVLLRYGDRVILKQAVPTIAEH